MQKQRATQERSQREESVCVAHKPVRDILRREPKLDQFLSNEHSQLPGGGRNVAGAALLSWPQEGVRPVSLPGFLTARNDGVVLSIKLQPRASANGIGEALGNELRIRVTAPPVDAAANEALVRLLAETLDCPRGHVELLRGQTSRHKTVRVHGLSAEQVLERLSAARS